MKSYKYLFLTLIFFGLLISNVIIFTKRNNVANVTNAASDNYLNFFTTGGTDFIVFNLNNYGLNPSLTTEPDLRYVLTQFHINPKKVTSELKDFCINGQKKLGFTLWYQPSAKGDTYSPMPSVADSTGGKPTAKVESNINAVLKLVADTTNASSGKCFEEIQFRFASMGPANPRNKTKWSSWNENQYLENKAFIYYIRNLVKTDLSGSGIRIFFDLDAEAGGQTELQYPAYMKRLWTDYTNDFGISDTYGFSITWVQNRFTNLMNIYNSVGKKPAQHAVDIYDTDNKGMEPKLTALFSEMKNLGEQNTPVIIQETYFNDSKAYSEIMQTAYKLGMNIRTVMQWQIDRSKWLRPDGKSTGFSTISSNFSYLPQAFAPLINNYGLGCADNKCIWIQGSAFTSLCNSSIYDLNSVLIKDLVRGTDLFCNTANYITIKIPSDVFDKYKYMFKIGVSSTNGKSSLVTISDHIAGLNLGPVPAISGFGLGCTDNKCVWVKGSNFSSSCNLIIYDSNSKYLTSLTRGPDLVCNSDSYLTFRIPDAVFDKYRYSLKFLTINSLGVMSAIKNLPDVVPPNLK
jgi:hypothetical protein